MIPLTLFGDIDRKRITAIGELLVEFIPANPAGLIHQPGSIVKTASGSSGIFACAVANLGKESGFLGQLGTDKLSKFVLDVVKAEGVDTSRVKISDRGQIGLAFVEYTNDGRNFQFYRKDSVGSKMTEEAIDEKYIIDSAAIHYSGMIMELGPEIRDACIKAVKVAKDNGVLVSFDPNIRKELIKDSEAVERLKWAVSQADIISPTLEEAKFVTGEEDLMAIIHKLHALGPKLVAVTRDKDGAVLSCGGEIISFGGIDINAIDPTGAGDTFAAALISGVLNGWDLKKIGLFSNSAGSLATMKQGSIGLALPTFKQVEEFMDKYKCDVRIISEAVRE